MTNLEQRTEEISENKTRRIFDSIKRNTGKVFNPRIGVPVGLLMASLAAYSHKEYGAGTMALVGARHFVTSSLIGSVAGRLCQYGARVKNPVAAYALGELYPMLFGNAVMLSVHYATGTPEPLKAIAGPALIAAAIVNPLTIYFTRKGILK